MIIPGVLRPSRSELSLEIVASADRRGRRCHQAAPAGTLYSQANASQTKRGQLALTTAAASCLICCLLLVSQQPTRTQALPHHPTATVSSSSPSSIHEQPPEIKTLNYLLYQTSRATAKSAADPPGRPEEAGAVEKLLKDDQHDHTGERVNISLANDIWRRWHANALQFARDGTSQARPAVNRLLDGAQVQAECKRSLNDLLDHLAALDEWAVRMYNSFGDFPSTGLFEGTFTSMGSYSQCVDVAPNELIGRPRYCTFKFQPVLPKRPRYHNILAPIDQLANFTNKEDMFHEIAKKAHYFFYIKLRLATCLPSKCSGADLDAIGRQGK